MHVNIMDTIQPQPIREIVERRSLSQTKRHNEI